MNKIIIKTSAITLGIIILIIGFTLSILTTFFPKTIANLALDLGYNKMAVYYLEKNYSNTNDINDLYTLINQSYLSNEYLVYIKYYEILEENEKYYEFMTFINDRNAATTTNKIVLSALINEDNYLKNNYVNALLKTNNLQKALNYGLQHFDYENYTLDNLGIYAFGNILTNYFINNVELKPFFEQEYNETGLSLIDSIYDYFNQSFLTFETNKHTTDSFRQVQLLALATRINKLAQNLQVVHDNSSILNSIDIEDVMARVASVNTALQNYL